MWRLRLRVYGKPKGSLTNLLHQIMTGIKRLKDWLKETLVPTLQSAEKPSVEERLIMSIPH